MAPFRKVLARARAKLTSFNLEVDTQSTDGLVAIYNGGTLNNISRTDLTSFIVKVANLKSSDEIQLFMPKKSYAIVKFFNVECADRLTQLTQQSEHTILGEI